MGSPWKALADDNRRQMLLLLGKKDMTPGDIARHFEFTFPATSTHLRVLKDADLIREQRQGKNRLYSLNREKTADMIQFFNALWNNHLNSLKEYLENKNRTQRGAKKGK